VTHTEPAADMAPPVEATARLDRTRATVAAGPLLAPVMARLVGIHAARAGLTVDRLEDAVLITDALAAQVAAVIGDERVPLSVQSEPGRIELRLGPLQPGDGRRLLVATQLPDTGPVLEILADEVHIRVGSGGGEMLVVRVGRRTLPGPLPG
jgi:hypothetical protein